MIGALACGTDTPDRDPVGGTGGVGGSGSSGTGGSGVVTGGSGANLDAAPATDSGVSGTGGVSGRPDGGATQGTDASDVAGPVTVESLFPLVVGNRWTYQTTVTTSPTSCQEGEHTTEILAAEEADGRHAFRASHFCQDTGTRLYAVTDEGLEVSTAPGGWGLFIPRPIVDGAQFGKPEYRLELRRIGTMSVAAGSFEECWQVRPVMGDGVRQTFCNNVGNVESVLVEFGTTESWRAELTSFSLQ